APPGEVERGVQGKLAATCTVPASEGSLDLATVASLSDIDLQSDAGGCRRHIPHPELADLDESIETGGGLATDGRDHVPPVDRPRSRRNLSIPKYPASMGIKDRPARSSPLPRCVCARSAATWASTIAREGSYASCHHRTCDDSRRARCRRAIRKCSIQ